MFVFALCLYVALLGEVYVGDKEDSQPSKKTMLCSQGKLAVSQQKVLAEQNNRKSVKYEGSCQGEDKHGLPRTGQGHEQPGKKAGYTATEGFLSTPPLDFFLVML